MSEDILPNSLSRRRALALGAASLATAGLAACQSSPPRGRLPELTYAHLGVFRLDVLRIDIINEYRAPLASPNVDHLLPTPPERTLERWARDRLTASGTPGSIARYLIQDAKLVETELKRTPGVRGAFTTDQAERYDLSLAAAIEVLNERTQIREAYASAAASRFRTVPEGITINEREKVWFDLVEASMNDINAELERQIRNNLARFLRT
jgi:hypothetical protein